MHAEESSGSFDISMYMDEEHRKQYEIKMLRHQRRMDPAKREAEKARDREAKKRKRQNLQFREMERARDRVRRRLARQDEARRREEQARNTEARRIARQNAVLRQEEHERNTAARRMARQKQQELALSILQNPPIPSKDEDPHSYYLQVIQRIWNDARNHLDKAQMNKLVAECTAFVMSKTMECLACSFNDGASNGGLVVEGTPSNDPLAIDINHIVNMACMMNSANSSDTGRTASSPAPSQTESVVCTPDIRLSLDVGKTTTSEPVRHGRVQLSVPDHSEVLSATPC